MEHTKGKLHWEGKTKGFKDEDKDGFYRATAATWLSGSKREPFLVPWDYESFACGLYISEANAKELVRRWNAFEEGGLVEELRIACEESQKAIMLLYECNKEVEIALGSGIQLKKAEELLKAVLPC